ncbi:Fc receptor, IgE, high affinity I, gamma polypeptide like isoform X1 [Thunnus albacares]|uniref:Fc receptor, IgE, high affinity I, gamma polypeptide like isoform X1 n=1 Tax=Thunnus maccoyii TaxID=8240 RepID=UPI001C4D9C17|nr:Fc receptor, IgE, high affinity I, gamma polypeptide like isoform X1 [Thunnus maccoyii]XP_044224844.1 Fc receptor, IgE, high affinity I, gamma polypeptide like isoform X1 [Thunnus albacares]
MMRASLITVFLMINPACAESLGNMNVCYILDGILILYGIILTVLYCRLRIHQTSKPANNPEKQPAEGGIYAVRLLILMLKKTFKMAHDGKVTAYRKADGSELSHY